MLLVTKGISNFFWSVMQQLTSRQHVQQISLVYLVKTSYSVNKLIINRKNCLSLQNRQLLAIKTDKAVLN